MDTVTKIPGFPSPINRVVQIIEQNIKNDKELKYVLINRDPDNSVTGYLFFNRLTAAKIYKKMVDEGRYVHIINANDNEIKFIAHPSLPESPTTTFITNLVFW